MSNAKLAPVRRSIFPAATDTWQNIAERELPELDADQAVKKITSDTAEIWGIPERGQLQPGYAADITIFDADRIDRGDEYYVQDVPGDGSRYVRDSIGIDTVIVGGSVAWTQAGGYTDACDGVILPGASA